MARFKVFTAKLANGQNLINVFGENKADARHQTYIALNMNPSRQPLYDRWVNDGKIVVNEKDA